MCARIAQAHTLSVNDVMMSYTKTIAQQFVIQAEIEHGVMIAQKAMQKDAMIVMTYHLMMICIEAPMVKIYAVVVDIVEIGISVMIAETLLIVTRYVVGKIQMKVIVLGVGETKPLRLSENTLTNQLLSSLARVICSLVLS